MTFFETQNYAQAMVVPYTNYPFLTSPAMFPILDCSGWAGARYYFLNNSTSPVVVTLTWYDNQADALAMTNNFCGKRTIVLATLASIYQDEASFTHPHLGNYLMIMCMATVGNITNFTVCIGHRQSEAITWGPATGQDIFLLTPGSHAFAANGTFDVQMSSPYIFAGRAAVHHNVTSTAASGGVWQLYAMDTTGTFQQIAASYLEHAPTSAPSARGQCPVLLPAAPTFLRLQNAAAAANTLSYAIITDTYRLR